MTFQFLKGFNMILILTSSANSPKEYTSVSVVMTPSSIDSGLMYRKEAQPGSCRVMCRSSVLMSGAMPKSTSMA